MSNPPPDRVELRAVDEARNIARSYAIELSADLFGATIVETRWGRIGGRGQCKRVSFDQIEQAQQHMTAALKRRSTAKRRLGVPYIAIVGELP